jgi:hypothetical protein
MRGGGSEDEGGGMQAALNILGASRRLGKEMEAKERGDRLATRTAAAAGAVAAAAAVGFYEEGHPLSWCQALCLTRCGRVTVFLKNLTKAVSQTLMQLKILTKAYFGEGKKTRFFVLTKCSFTKSSDHYGNSRGLRRCPFLHVRCHRARRRVHARLVFPRFLDERCPPLRRVL